MNEPTQAVQAEVRASAIKGQEKRVSLACPICEIRPGDLERAGFRPGDVVEIIFIRRPGGE